MKSIPCQHCAPPVESAYFKSCSWYWFGIQLAQINKQWTHRKGKKNSISLATRVRLNSEFLSVLTHYILACSPYSANFPRSLFCISYLISRLAKRTIQTDQRTQQSLFFLLNSNGNFQTNGENTSGLHDVRVPLGKVCTKNNFDLLKCTE